MQSYSVLTLLPVWTASKVFFVTFHSYYRFFRLHRSEGMPVAMWVTKKVSTAAHTGRNDKGTRSLTEIRVFNKATDNISVRVGCRFVNTVVPKDPTCVS